MHPTLFLAVKDSVGPQITKDRLSHVMAFYGQATVDDKVRESGSTLIAIIIILEC